VDTQVRNRIIKWTIGILLSTVLLFVLAVFVLLRYYEDELAKYAIEQSKVQFKTEVRIGDVDLAFWQTFPHASLELQNVFVESASRSKDTLLSAEKIFLEFDLFDLLGDRIHLHTLDFHRGDFHPEVNNKGVKSWDILKQQESNQESVTVQLEEIALSDMDIRYHHQTRKQFLHVLVGRSHLVGDFSEARYEGSLFFKGSILAYQDEQNQFTEQYDLTIDAEVDVDSDDQRYSWTDAELSIHELELQTSGWVHVSDESTLFNVGFNADEAPLADILSLAPGKWTEYAEQYGAYGRMKLSGNFAQEKPNTEVKWDIQLSGADGELKHSDSGVELDQLEIQAKVSGNGTDVTLELNELAGAMAGGQLGAHGVVHWGGHQDMDLFVKANTSLTEFMQFIALDSVEANAGNVSLDLHLVGPIPTRSANKSVQSLIAEGAVSMQDAGFVFTGSSHELSQLNLVAAFNRNELQIQNMAGQYGGVPFQLSGSLVNMTNFLVGSDQRLKAHVSLQLQELNLDPWLTDDPNASHDGKFGIPPDVDFSIEANVANLSYKGFAAQQVHGICSVTDRRIAVSPLDFKALNGSVNSEMKLIPEADGYRYECRAQLNQISLPQAFHAFENFHQTFIREENIQGNATAQVQFTSLLNADWKIVDESISSIVSIRVENGELNNLPAMVDVANAIRANKWFSPFVNEDDFERKTKHIQFSTLENIIEIQNKVVYIPEMDIESSAMNISVVGTHSFDGAINYSLGFSLRDLWRPKDPSQDKKGLQLFIAMKGTTDQPTFTFDRDASKQDRREKIQAEKEQIREMLRDEFGGWKEKRTNEGASAPVEVQTVEDSLKDVKRTERRRKWKEILIDE
jgi:uncharacterized protein involved in outer membrane biogenesis